MSDRVIEVPAGRRGADGLLELKPFTQNIISLSVSRVDERIPPLLLTKAQAIGLRDAVDEIAELKEEASTNEETYVEGVERRRSAA